MEIFAAFTDIERMKFMVCSDLLTSDLKIRLWDNIGKESRLKMWRSTMNVLVTKHCQHEISEEKEESNLPAKQQTLNSQQRLLHAITVAQRSRLWSNLLEQEQKDLL